VPNSQPDDAVAKLSRSLNRYQAIVVGGVAFVVVFAVTVMGVMLWQSFRLGQEAAKVENVAVTTHDALCAFTGDLKTRYTANVKLLRDHPEDPIRAFGLEFPRATLVNSTTGQKATLDSLKGLSCE
jgi:hypothetical protein